MSILGEAVVYASVELLIKKLGSSDLLSFASQEQIHADLKKWEKTLRKISAVLEDAEEKQITNRSVNKWLFDLQNLAYDVEDLLDEFATAALERKLTHQPTEASTSKVRKFIPTCCSNLNPRSIKFNVKMASEMKKITERFQEITAQKNNLDLRENSEAKSNKVRDQRRHTTSLPESHVYGREKDQEAIIELLLKDEGNEDGVSVIPILGMGGLGKTTLARNVYNDARVKNHFDLQVWVCVSDDFDITRITKAILQSIGSVIGDFSELNNLQVELKEKLLRKNFLIVLDDIWNRDYIEWMELLRPFKSSSSRGKIIVTTRIKDISSMVGTLPTYQLTALSYDDCLSLFTHHALRRNNFDEHKDLKEIGEKIANRCKGLPLAAKALGGLLYGNVNCNFWKRVLNSKLWSLPNEGSEMIIPALKLSYQYLPPHLKRCFVYCSLLPNDYEFQKEEIILLWMAQGFLQQESSEMQMEDLGEEYFQELQSRSFFQQLSNDTSRYVMHDLVNDLARWVAGEMFFIRVDKTVEGNKRTHDFQNLRHLSYVGGRYDGIKKFEAFYGVNDLCNLTYNGGLRDDVKILDAFNDSKHLRTFLQLQLPSYGNCYLTRDIIHMMPKLQRLRALSLNGYSIRKLPNAIGDLKYLRYLDLCYTDIHVLPESISSIYNLQILKLIGCHSLKKLCTDMGNLINLRYLNVSSIKRKCSAWLAGVANLEGMPLRFGELTGLRTLSDFVVGKNTGSQLKELKFLKQLRGTLRISGLQNISDVEDAKEAELYGKRNLTVLHLGWSSCDARNADIEKQVLDMLRPGEELQELSISGYDGLTFPTWLGQMSFSNLVLLRFENCSNCISLPSVGQLPLLKELYISKMAGIKSVGPEFYGNHCSRPFPLLEILCFEDMPEWEDWKSHGFSHEVEGLPHLRELTLLDCPKLRERLPEHLTSLKRLVIQRCEQLVVSALSLPMCSWVKIRGCKQVEQRSTVGLSGLSDISSHMFLIERFMQTSSDVEEVELVLYKEPTSFWRSGIISWKDAFKFFTNTSDEYYHQLRSVYFLEKELQQPQELPYRHQYLTLWNCVCLAKLPQALHNLSFLTKLCIAECPKLVCFPEAALPSHLRSIEVLSCNALKSLPRTCMGSTSLENLSIEYCKSLMYIARNRLPSNLKRLGIGGCDNLRGLMQEENNNLPATLEVIGIHNCLKLESIAERFENHTALKTINISDCESLKSLPTGGDLPYMNLTSLHIRNCEKLEALPNCMHQLNHLQQITIWGCSSLVSFPDGGLPSTNLTSLEITNCKTLEALPNHMQNLTSVRRLTIENCLSIKSFPENGFPTNLISLEIANLKIFDMLFRWGLHRLTYLRELYMEGCPDVVSFPLDERGIMLPTSLTSLSIKDFPNLECLSAIILSLNSMEKLHLVKCPKLKYFPEKGLPLLSELYIHCCPLLEQKCKEDRGQYWSMISHIPAIWINNDWL